MKALAFVLAIATAGCAARPLVKLPSGLGEPAPDASGALQQAIGACLGIRSLTAEVAVGGTAEGRRIRARLTAGVSPPASARLEAVSPFGQPFFIFVATGDDATLLLPRENRVLEHGRPGEVLEALTGVPLEARDLHDMLTGCADSPAAATLQAHAYGDLWRLVEAGHDTELFLHRETPETPWRLVAVVSRSGGRSWRIDYGGFENSLPRAIRLTSLGAPPASAFDLHLTLSQIEVNAPLDAEAFRVKIPDSARPIAVDELRRSSPLPSKTDAR
jgi:hypothetical protein